jgi:hypothetical protein
LRYPCPEINGLPKIENIHTCPGLSLTEKTFLKASFKKLMEKSEKMDDYEKFKKDC